MATVLPFLAGSFLAQNRLIMPNFIFGLLAAVFMHLGANLINDYADSKSGNDWQDKKFYGLFGGSKLIQEGLLSEKFYLTFALSCFSISVLAVIFLSLLTQRVETLIYFLIILVLGWSYSAKPLQLAYKRVGELIIFLLFGPAVVMGAYFLQTGIFPDFKSFLLSVPFGLFTTAILFANEVPDYEPDKSVSKLNWVSLTGDKRAYILYYILQFAALSSILLNVVFENLNIIALSSFILFFPVFEATKKLKNHYFDRDELIKSSSLTIRIQTIAGIIIILSLWL